MHNRAVLESSKRRVWKVLCSSTRLLHEVSDPTTLCSRQGCGYHFLSGSSSNLKVEAIVPELTTPVVEGGGGSVPVVLRDDGNHLDFLECIHRTWNAKCSG
jgi:hypothetical protein